MPISERGRRDLEMVLDDFWKLYKTLKDYKNDLSANKCQEIRSQFDELFQRNTSCETLNQALKRLFANKTELLVVLGHPQLPLHNNTSESDIREYVKRRKVSGGTRSDDGQMARDTFASLKKTCRKLKVSFWSFLKDIISEAGQIPRLPILIRAAIENSRLKQQTSAA